MFTSSLDTDEAGGDPLPSEPPPPGKCGTIGGLECQELVHSTQLRDTP